ncbi:Uncharacterised protein [Mycobacteroides abscessus]|nr:Uncharacterised protein [Mycobacteroides abscessus]
MGTPSRVQVSTCWPEPFVVATGSGLAEPATYVAPSGSVSTSW